MPCKDCEASNGLYHYSGISPYDGKFFQETYECQECGHTEDTKIVPFFRELIYRDIPPPNASGLTQRAADENQAGESLLQRFLAVFRR